MAAELMDRVVRAFDSALDRYYGREEGSLNDAGDLNKLSLLLIAADQRVWVEGTLDPRVGDMLKAVVPEEVDRRSIGSKGPGSFIIVDNGLISFVGERFLLERKPPESHLREFEKPFEQGIVI